MVYPENVISRFSQWFQSAQGMPSVIAKVKNFMWPALVTYTTLALSRTEAQRKTQRLVRSVLLEQSQDFF